MGRKTTSPKGSVWAEVEDNPALSSAAKLAAATLQAAGARSIGTNQIIAAGDLQDPAAQVIASGVGRFLKIEASQIIAGTGNFDEAVAQKLWAQIVTAREGVFDKIKANMLAAGALDGQLITGTTIRTASFGRRVVMDANGFRIEGGQEGDDSFRIDAATGRVTMTGGIISRDEWSWVNFSDWYLAGGDNGIVADLGMGLGFNRSVSPTQFPGGIYLFKTTGGELGTAIVPPHNPGLQGGRMHIRPYDIEWGGEQCSFKIEREFFQMSAARGGLYLSAKTTQMTLRSQYSRTNLILGGQSTHAFVQLGDSSDTGTGYAAGHGWAQVCTLNGFRSNGYFSVKGTTASLWSKDGGQFLSVSPSGLSSSGRTKQFIMHVPRLSNEHGGKMLRHKCSESPYDGIEYWTTLKLDDSGAASWDLPDYVPVIASRRAPWAVLATADRGHANATLERGESLYRVHVTGEPGAEVSVLVKGARIVEMEGASGGVSRWKDLGDESPWADNPVTSAYEEGAFPDHEDGDIEW